MLIMSFTLFGQEPGSYISVTGGLGGGGFEYKLKGLSYDGLNKDKLTWNAKIGYSYFFTPNWGLSTGVGVSYYRTVGKYDSTFSQNTFFNLGNQIDDDYVSGSPTGYELRVRFQHWQEEQKGYFIEIPLMAMYQHKFGEEKRHGFYVGLGAKLQIPVFSKYKVLDGDKPSDLRLNVSGRYYDDPTLELGAPRQYPTGEEPMDPPLPAHGFGSISNPYAQLGWGGDMDLKMSVAGTVELGFLIGLSERIDLTIGGFFDYGFNNIKKGSNKDFLEAPQQYLPAADNALGNGIQYNGMVNTENTNKVNMMGYGGKIGLQIRLGKKIEKPLDTIPLPMEMIDDTIPVDNSDLDSLLKQLEEMRNMLNDLVLQPEPEPQPQREPEPESLIVLQGVVLDAKSRDILSAVVELTDLRTNQLVAITRTDSLSGKFKFPLNAGGNFILDVRKEGYLYYSERINIPNLNTKQVIDQVVLLSKIEVNQVIILKNIFFDTGKSTLKAESMVELEHVYRLMLDNPTMVIEISGHTDNVGTEAVNKKLSLARAGVVVQTLVNKGIPSNRMTSVGYGFDKPISPNTTADGRAQNRRTEFKVLKM